MPITWDKRNKRWRFLFDRTIEGRRARSSKLLPKGWSHTQARAYEKEQDARLYAVATGVQQVETGQSVTRAVQLYLENRLPKLRDGKHTAQEIAHLLPWIENRTLEELGDISRSYAEDNPGLAPATIRNRLAYLRAAVRYAHKKHRYGAPGVTDQMELPAVSNERQVYLQANELEPFLSNIQKQDARDLYTLAFYTGLRWRHNILSLTPDKIIRKGKDVWLDIGRTKNGEPMMVWVHPSARDALRSIPFQRGDRYFYDAFRAARAAVKRPEVRPHDLRHSLASVLVNNGVSLKEVGAVLGHKSLQATNRYAHLYPHRVADLVRRVPSVRFSRTKADVKGKTKKEKVA